jgi:hypothetical protein
MTLGYCLVAIPKEHITIRNYPNNKKYVFLVLETYRNTNKKPTSKDISIGKIDQTTGNMMIPNKNYFTYFPNEVPTIAQETNLHKDEAEEGPKINDYGNIYILTSLTHEIGLLGILQECFPSIWEDMLVIIFYMVCNGNIMANIDNFAEISDLEIIDWINSQKCSEIFAGISFTDRMKFFKSWIKNNSDNEYIVYDVSSISTYAKKIDKAEYGYNRDKEKLPQINLGLFIGEKSGLPIYYNSYQGSINDKTELVFMLDHTETLGIKNIKFVLDRGFVTEPNLNFMVNNGHKFLIPLSNTLNEAKFIVSLCKNKIRARNNWINSCSVYGFNFDYEIYGLKVKVHIIYDQDKLADAEKSMHDEITSISESTLKHGADVKIRNANAFYNYTKY